jgi:hypothetical protein
LDNNRLHTILLLNLPRKSLRLLRARQVVESQIAAALRELEAYDFAQPTGRR